jgi:peroxiredoxin
MKENSQTKLIFNLLSDGEAHSTHELVNLIKPGGGLVRISERIREIMKQKGIIIESFRDDKDKTMWWYQIKATELEPRFDEMPEYEKWKNYYNNLGQGKLI